jgi:hypothetical protein
MSASLAFTRAFAAVSRLQGNRPKCGSAIPQVNIESPRLFHCLGGFFDLSKTR